jgi:carboxyl-terminal processing protease
MVKIQSQNKSFWKFFGVSVLGIFSLFCAFAAGAYMSKSSITIGNLAQKEVEYFSGQESYNNPKFNETLYQAVWNTLKQSFVDRGQLDDQKLFYGSLKGLVAASGDPYTVFMDPEENKEFQDDLAGTFEGIGAEIGLKDEIITIISPLDDMPAAKAGIRAGDQIYAINGTSTAGVSVDEAVRQIRGPKDTQVKLTIYRSGENNTKDYTITRSVIVVKSVKTERRDDGVYVIKISAFNNDTGELFSQAINEIINVKPKGIILDMRNNPGGYLDTAVDMASEWIENGPVVIEKFSEEKQNKYLSTGTGRLKDVPTAVLINGGSASASEIVAGALQDYQKALIIGEKSFGKGSVQSLIDLGGGASLKVTIAKWLTPLGRSINDEGIKPDREVKFTEEDAKKDKDPQFQAALDYLQNKKSGTK